MNLPASFTEYTRALLGVEEYEKLVSALQQEPPVSIRLNRLKVHRLKVENALSVQPPWSSEGIYLDERAPFNFRPVVSCRVLLCAGGFFDVRGTGAPAACHEAGGDARPLCRSGREIDPCS